MKKKLHITVICYICILFFSLSGCASVTNAKANASFNNNFEQNKLEMQEFGLKIRISL